jgi:ABC-type sugar transport system permease subunit
VSFLDVHKEPTRLELRLFGVLFAAFCGLVGSLLRWQAGAGAAALAVWGVGIAFLLVYYAVPPIQRVAFRAWIRVTFPIGWTVSHAVLAVVWYGIFTPIGLLLRLSGRDVLKRRFERGAPTYWVAHEPAEAASRYFKQF